MSGVTTRIWKLSPFILCFNSSAPSLSSPVTLQHWKHTISCILWSLFCEVYATRIKICIITCASQTHNKSKWHKTPHHWRINMKHGRSKADVVQWNCTQLTFGLISMLINRRITFSCWLTRSVLGAKNIIFILPFSENKIERIEFGAIAHTFAVFAFSHAIPTIGLYYESHLWQNKTQMGQYSKVKQLETVHYYCN